MSGVLNAAIMAGVKNTLVIRAADRADVINKIEHQQGAVTVIDARTEPDPTKWAAAIPAIRASTVCCTARDVVGIDKFAAAQAEAGERVLVIVLHEADARAWRALVAMHQRSPGSLGRMTRGAA